MRLLLALVVAGGAVARQEESPRDHWERIEAAAPGAERWLARAELLTSSGDPAGALISAREGLQLDPADRRLLYQAAYAAIWLEQLAAAEIYCSRLQRVLVERPPEDVGERESWHLVADRLDERRRELNEHAATLERRLLVARLIATTGSLAAASGIVLLARTRTTQVRAG